MKKTMEAGLLLVLAMVCAPAHALFEQATEEDKTVQAIYEVPGASQAKILADAKLWIAENFRSARNVIDHEVPADGLLIAKGAIPYPCDGFSCVAKSSWLVRFTMRMEAKDGRYRLTFTNLMLSMPEELEPWEKSDYEAIRPKLLEIGEAIKKAVNSPTRVKDW